MRKSIVFRILHFLTAGLILLLSFSCVVCIGEESVVWGLSLVSAVFVMLYGIFLYKKPHGNMLKYAFLLLGFCILLTTQWTYTLGNGRFLEATILSLTGGMICYCAGRLNRIEQNRFLFPVIGVGLVISLVLKLSGGSDISNPFRCIAEGGNLIVFAALSLAYFSRFEEHREAGQTL